METKRLVALFLFCVIVIGVLYVDIVDATYISREVASKRCYETCMGTCRQYGNDPYCKSNCAMTCTSFAGKKKGKKN